MNKRLFDALVSLSGSSSSARTLAENVMKDASPELVQQLYDKIRQLESQIADLTTFEETPEEVSDSEARVLGDAFSLIYSKMDWNKLRQSTGQHLQQYSNAVRLIIVTALCNRAHELKQRPLDVWLDIIALGGELK